MSRRDQRYTATPTLERAARALARGLAVPLLVLVPPPARSVVAASQGAGLPAAAVSAGSRAFEASASPDGRVVRVEVDGQEVLRLTDGIRLRLRCSPNKDRWLGYDEHEIGLGWCPNDNPEVTGARAVVEEAGARLRIAIEGAKPQWPGATFRTTITGELGETGAICYTISSALRLQPATAAALRSDGLGIEFLDVWFDKIFWPERYLGDRERYDELVFGTPTGIVRTPKLHVFPVSSIPSTTYPTVAQPTADGSFYAVLDTVAEEGFLFDLSGLSSAGQTALCWYTWDSHFLLWDADSENRYTYAVTITALDRAATRALRERATPIPFDTDPAYAVPVFALTGTNDFRQRIRNSTQWAWERTSADAFMDSTVGYDDRSSVTIRGRPEARSAWYCRALWADPWSQIPITGTYRLSAMVRTSRVKGAARIGVVKSDQVDSLLYGETSPAFTYSAALSGNHEWTPVTVDFEANGRQVKVVLEQSGPGQTWFDNARVDPLCDPLPGEQARVAFYARPGGRDPVKQFDLWECRASRREVLNPIGLTLAWPESWVSTPSAALRPGRYRLIVHARGDGCEASPPVMRVSGPPGLDVLVQVRPDANDDYAVGFEVATAQVASFQIAFVNDGPCETEGGAIKDRNIFVRAISLEGPIDARP